MTDDRELNYAITSARMEKRYHVAARPPNSSGSTLLNKASYICQWCQWCLEVRRKT